MATNYVIVVSVLEGKNFPTRHDKLLLVEAKFDSEVMATDPVPHVIRPHFNTELAWEVDKKGLQTHRLHRAPIKLQWYAVDMELTKKEQIGYVVLDIRLAQEKLQSPKWFLLLSSKYQKEKPEVLLSLYLERVTEDIAPPSTDSNKFGSKRNSFSEERNGHKRPGSSMGNHKPSPVKPCNGTLGGSNLKPVWVSHAGYYQIGPPEMCNEMFKMSVTVAFAANLNKLAPPAMLKSSKGFYFYYSLFDNDVTTEKFSNLSNPNFPTERVSVSICSSSKLLSEYFKEHPGLEIVLWSGDVSLGSGQIPLEPFSCVNRHNINEDPLCIEGSVQIVPTEKTARMGGDDLSPFVSVNVVLQTDKPVEKTSHKENTTPIREDSIPEEKVETSFPETMSFVTRATGSGVEISNNHDNCKTNNDSALPNESHVYNNGSNNPGRISCNHSSLNTPMEAGDSRNFDGPPISIPMKLDSSAKHFSFTLDLCNFKATRLAHTINLFIRYSYPFFGTTSSMVTHPDVEVHPKCEVSIPHGYCAFNFATTFAMLKSTFWETPLILEVLHRTKSGQEQNVGTARINLFQVLDAPSINHVVDKKRGTRQMTSCKVVVTSNEGYEIGEIYAALTLIDFGHTSALCNRHSNQSSMSCFPQVRNFIPNFEMSMLRQNGLSQDELLQAALELELWQERQREMFRAQLKDKEMQHLSILSSEWKQRDTERELMLQKQKNVSKLKKNPSLNKEMQHLSNLSSEWKQRDTERELMLQKQYQECKSLEAKLKNTLKDAEMKEKQISSQQAELNRRLQTIEKEREEQQREAKKRVESIKLEYNEMFTREQFKVRDLESKNSSLLHQIRELERELQEQKHINDSLKSQLNKGPDVHLRTEVNILNMEKAELQQKLETALASKQKYKIQWGQAVRQLSALQQKLHFMERLEMTKKDEEMASVQQHILSSEERNAAQNKDDILEMMKDKVESLKSMVSPESAKLLDRQMSLNIDNSHTVPTTAITMKSRSDSNGVSKSTSNSTHSNSSANHSHESILNKPNTNAISNVSSDNIKHHMKSSLIPQPVKHLPDLNGNTNTSEGLQHLLSKKEALLTTGYTEKDHLIKDLNTHIEKAKLASK